SDVRPHGGPCRGEDRRIGRPGLERRIDPGGPERLPDVVPDRPQHEASVVAVLSPGRSGGPNGPVRVGPVRGHVGPSVAATSLAPAPMTAPRWLREGQRWGCVSPAAGTLLADEEGDADGG